MSTSSHKNPIPYVILVNSAPFSQQGSMTAYNFAKAALKRGHHLTQIFFYANGIYNGNKLIAPPEDELNVVALWQELAAQQGVKLVICIAASQRRGLVGETQDLVAAGFTVSGLGQLITAIMQAERFLVFN